MHATDAMFQLEQCIMGAGRGGSSPDTRRKRPLSIIAENLDEENGGSAETSVAETSAAKDENSSQQTDSHPISTETGSGEGGLPLPSARSPLQKKKTRKKAIVQQCHPVLNLTVPNGRVVTSPLDPSPTSACPSPVSEAVPATPSCQNQATVPASGSEGDLTRLKDTATKLNLKTRRQSYLTWRAKYVDKVPEKPEVVVVPGSDGKLTKERKERMDNALQWIKGQLIDLRRQDQSLARQLLGIRHELSSLKLAVSCEEHQDLLDDAQDQMEELKELSRFVDFPPEVFGTSPLRHIGVTKMNISSRRFSTC